ncbi:hypothetical protein FSP39_000425 [Pinctada imbricata]|uniref:VWFA domain-containing protein n=1 Tax=Pinctada imbricata TaxID=66713 RepID=A0AA89BVC3_PINIB|nr:hypothetical protein FSP39_000425 [Pinctada imbricata]
MAVPPGGPFEICFSFDTTGSMSSSITEVKGRVQDMIQRLQADIPGIRIAVFAHGDYCDKNSSYVTKHIDFSTNVADLCKWVKNVGSTGGGDSDECYELVLHEVQDLSWTPGSQRALVMIGDANPHEPNYPQNTLKLDWRKEADKLAAMAVRIYSVYVNRCSGATNFYNEIAKRTGGRKVDLENFSNMFDFIMAICYREHGAEFLDVYEKEVRARDASKGIHKDLDAMFGALRDDTSGPVAMDTSSSAPLKKKLPFKPSLSKKPSLTKSASITSLKKAASLTMPTKKISKPRKRLTAEERKKQKQLSKFKFENLPKLKREDVTENYFNLNMLSWTPWQLAISSKAAHEMENSEQWMDRKDDKGCKRCQLFGGKTNVAALYEVSVQRCQKAKRYVLYNKFCSGFTKSWDSRLLGGRSIRAQIDNVLSQGCNVYIRRAVLGSESKQEVSKSLKRYDYAWRKLRLQRSGPRAIVKSSVKLSVS